MIANKPVLILDRSSCFNGARLHPGVEAALQRKRHRFGHIDIAYCPLAFDGLKGVALDAVDVELQQCIRAVGVGCTLAAWCIDPGGCFMRAVKVQYGGQGVAYKSHTHQRSDVEAAADDSFRFPGVGLIRYIQSVRMVDSAALYVSTQPAIAAPGHTHQTIAEFINRDNR